ncbi:hypothetical protein [Vagococcus intermedius]|uniref:Uncharacterized protein n=1 Tax=Vagococcus intermedius TaxID=2991418 RepID=A0AAF0CWE0_9ENTE|nr:hypothetical protein [Vagococcus intermedius]WEG74214.1 hypothetical protein OL234_04775 [Vagococcus intermedius]WEG76295.1 hypothetical protein OL235_04780 [Vagococcus intermedius]
MNEEEQDLEVIKKDVADMLASLEAGVPQVSESEKPLEAYYQEAENLKNKVATLFDKIYD